MTEAGEVPAAQPHPRSERLLVAVVVSVYLLVIVRGAWLSDDSFISFRAAANLARGHGLTTNVAERVQAFTSPLWTLLFAAFYPLVGDTYALGIVLGLIVSLAAALLVATRAPGGPVARALAVGTLAVSQAYADYSTSGLENPLSHLLLVGLVCHSYGTLPRRLDRPATPFAIAGLLALNRMDHVLLAAPTLVAACVSLGPRRAIRAALSGFAPLIAWVTFAVVYYGFPFPNTAYAKLNLLIPRSAVLLQGLSYLMETLQRDPVTALVIGAALAGAIAVRERTYRLLAAGVALYVAYVVSVGGDFMLGRFLTCPFLVSTLILAALGVPSPHWTVALGAAAAAVLAVAPLSPLRERDTRCMVPPSGVVDERACYETHTGLRANIRTPAYETHQYYQDGKKARDAGRRVGLFGAAGLTGLAAGDRVHLVDFYALTDPLLARIPFEARGEDWRIGHFRRDVPDGYLQSLETGKNRVRDPALHRLLDDLWLVTRGPLFSRARWAAIVRLNLRRG